MTNFRVCVSLLVLLLKFGESRSNKICCTQYDGIKLPTKALKYYVEQDATQFCNITAIIFQTVINKLLCANPESKWVKRAMEVVPHFNQWKKSA